MKKDLVVLAADRSIEQAVAGILDRPEAIGIRAIMTKLLVHPERDPGCFHSGADLVAPFAGEWSRALVIFDLAWEGAPHANSAALAEVVDEKLKSAWGNRARTIVIDPELEVWVWSDSPHVARALGWKKRRPKLRAWLEKCEIWEPGRPKPADPKLAVERTLRETRIPRSSAVYREIAGKVSLDRCEDPSFKLLLSTLRSWFGSHA